MVKDIKLFTSCFFVFSLFLVMMASSLFASGITYKRTLHGYGGGFSGYVDIKNETGYDIDYLSVSHTDDWWWFLDDVLRSGTVLYNGQSIRVNLENFPSAIFDIFAEDEDMTSVV